MSNTEKLLSKLKPMDLPPLPENSLVSVLIANYNYGQYIGEAIESVLNQTYQNFEIIICDDGSTDNSLEVIKEYEKRDNRIKYIAKENGGMASALNVAYAQSKGDIIAFLDSDDVFTNNKLQEIVQAFKTFTQVGFIIHKVVQMDSNGKNLGVYPLSSKLPSGWIAEELLAQGGIMEFPPMSGLCLRREVANVIFPLNPEFRTNADGIIQRIAPLLTIVFAIDVPLAKRRIHQYNITYSNQITAEYIEKQIQIGQRLWEEQYNFLKHWAPNARNNLQRFDRSIEHKILSYVLQRIRNKRISTSGKTWKELINHPDFKKFPLIRKVLWYVSYLLPSPVFKKFINLWWTSNSIKRMISTVLWR